MLLYTGRTCSMLLTNRRRTLLYVGRTCFTPAAPAPCCSPTTADVALADRTCSTSAAPTLHTALHRSPLLSMLLYLNRLSPLFSTPAAATQTLKTPIATTFHLYVSSPL
uniref:Uncharacterized protein n=1 Tax=Cucumis melo subsp. melo TaxID=412675 RepID=E5GBC4_CUCME|nr:hypothetical protein [Cucumis melo subsp. melo]